MAFGKACELIGATLLFAGTNGVRLCFSRGKHASSDSSTIGDELCEKLSHALLEKQPNWCEMDLSCNPWNPNHIAMGWIELLKLHSASSAADGNSLRS